MGHKFVLYIFFSSSDTLACVAAVTGGGLSLLFLLRFSPSPPRLFFASAMQAYLFREGRVINSASLPLEPEPVKLSLRRRNIYVYPPDEYLDKDLSPYPPEEQLQLEWV